ncbi:LRR domain containing protein [Parasponia andersonii]|uniref:LRR domain containing protein n=1 Tax=Parasponia andersonii TaxID=3476 RepID=A0A2P5BSR5_PARAD|nr:LRR domain containing protein [Parasponia andersonii]
MVFCAQLSNRSFQAFAFREESRDLSFNNINGQIPNSLFNISSLSTLTSLLTIDLPYNKLVGSIPSWVNSTQNLELVISWKN